MRVTDRQTDGRTDFYYARQTVAVLAGDAIPLSVFGLATQYSKLFVTVLSHYKQYSFELQEPASIVDFIF